VGEMNAEVHGGVLLVLVGSVPEMASARQGGGRSPGSTRWTWKSKTPAQRCNSYISYAALTG
jgi:hypothetical protein